ncbi:MAG: hypothetical protein GY719_13475 [bacterium]|nr:hypothetical protein [bacterium]
MRRLLVCLLLATVAIASPARAVLCASDEVPAATLLVPWFTVDLDACGTEIEHDTIVTVVNTSAASVVAQMTLWTDWGVPTINFSLYLTGYDQQTISLAAAFCDGELPLTGPTILSPHGELSGPPPSLPICELIEPSLTNPLLTGALLDRVRNGHTGAFDASFGGCAGSDHGDDVARGYLTFDVVGDCSVLFPSDPGYFDGTAAFSNVLMGQVLYAGPEVFQSLSAVHIEADTEGTVFSSGDHTFYGRYVGGDASDRREPLPTVFSANFSRHHAVGDLLVWRESTAGGPAACGNLPANLPIAQSDVLVFDEEENPLSILPDVGLVTNAVPVADVVPPGLADVGWLVLDERHPGVASLYGDDRAQAWVGYLSRPDLGLPFVGREAFALSGPCSADVLEPHRVFADGFESGDTSAW